MRICCPTIGSKHNQLEDDTVGNQNDDVKLVMCVRCGGEFLEEMLDSDHMCEVCAHEYEDEMNQDYGD